MIRNVIEKILHVTFKIVIDVSDRILYYNLSETKFSVFAYIQSGKIKISDFEEKDTKRG